MFDKLSLNDHSSSSRHWATYDGMESVLFSLEMDMIAYVSSLAKSGPSFRNAYDYV